MVDSHSSPYGAWEYADTSPPAVLRSVSTASLSIFDHSTAVHNPFTLQSSLLDTPYSPLPDDSLVALYSADDGDCTSLRSCLRSPSPFPAALIASEQSLEQFDAGSGADSLHDDASSSSSVSLPSPLPSSSASSSTPSTVRASTSSADASRSAASARPLKRTRERIRGLTREQRAERKRTKHREIDTMRRQREIAAMSTLRDIVTHQSAPKVENDDEEVGGQHTNRGIDEAEVTSKAAVLQSSVDLIRQLQAMCAKMQEACNAKDKQIVRLACNLQNVVDSRDDNDSESSTASDDHNSALLAVTGQVSRLERSSCLRQSYCLSSTLCMAVFVMPTSMIVDCNEAFVKCGGWSRAQLLETVIRPPDDAIGLPMCPLMLSKRRRRRPHLVCLDDDVDEHRVDTSDDVVVEHVAQFGSSWEAIAALIEGRQHKVECIWRHRAADGHLYEGRMSAWREGSLSSIDGQQQKVADVTSCRMVTAYASYDKVMVDEGSGEVGLVLG